METFLKEFQDSVYHLSPVVLIGAGFVLIWMGLSLWLGGLKWLKILAAFAGAAVGYTLASCWTENHLYMLISFAVLGGFIALFIEKTIVVFGVAVLTAVLVNVLIAWPTLAEDKTWEDTPKMELSKDSPPNVVQSLTVLETYTRYVCQKSVQIIKSLGSVGYTAAIIAILVVLGVGFVMPRGVCALGCAVIGVSWIALGLLLLLLYKGAKPIDYVIQQAEVLAITAVIVVAFGTLVDLALCPDMSKKKSGMIDKSKGKKK
ncbi:MAG: hypothetical protein JXB18_09410 [Sedimentisphaerales bacterium]|nr:hypothetical protein [Sedimentisphaerales bacterium]